MEAKHAVNVGKNNWTFINPYFQNNFTKRQKLGSFGTETNHSYGQNVTGLYHREKSVKYFHLTLFIIVAINSYRIKYLS